MRPAAGERKDLPSYHLRPKLKEAVDRVLLGSTRSSYQGAQTGQFGIVCRRSSVQKREYVRSACFGYLDALAI